MIYETVYTSRVQPDMGSARDVLAFLLLPASAFVSAQVDRDSYDVVHRLLVDAQRDVLLSWYRQRGGTP